MIERTVSKIYSFSENRIILDFEGDIPSYAIRNKIKTVKYRWDPENKVWWAYRSDDAVELAKEIFDRRSPEASPSHSPLNNKYGNHAEDLEKILIQRGFSKNDIAESFENYNSEWNIAALSLEELKAARTKEELFPLFEKDSVKSTRFCPANSMALKKAFMCESQQLLQ